MITEYWNKETGENRTLVPIEEYVLLQSQLAEVTKERDSLLEWKRKAIDLIKTKLNSKCFGDGNCKYSICAFLEGAE